MIIAQIAIATLALLMALCIGWYLPDIIGWDIDRQLRKMLAKRVKRRQEPIEPIVTTWRK